MASSELELFTTQELIRELMRRKTFLGVVVHAKEEHKADEWKGDGTFKVHFNSNLDAAQACNLLSAVADYMNHNCR